MVDFTLAAVQVGTLTPPPADASGPYWASSGYAPGRRDEVGEDRFLRVFGANTGSTSKLFLQGFVVDGGGLQQGSLSIDLPTISGLESDAIFGLGGGLFAYARSRGGVAGEPASQMTDLFLIQVAGDGTPTIADRKAVPELGWTFLPASGIWVSAMHSWLLSRRWHRQVRVSGSTLGGLEDRGELQGLQTTAAGDPEWITTVALDGSTALMRELNGGAPAILNLSAGTAVLGTVSGVLTLSRFAELLNSRANPVSGADVFVLEDPAVTAGANGYVVTRSGQSLTVAAPGVPSQFDADDAYGRVRASFLGAQPAVLANNALQGQATSLQQVYAPFAAYYTYDEFVAIVNQYYGSAEAYLAAVNAQGGVVLGFAVGLLYGGEENWGQVAAQDYHRLYGINGANQLVTVSEAAGAVYTWQLTQIDVVDDGIRRIFV